EALAHKYGAKVQTAEEAMADPNVLAVMIASATDTHADLIEQAARAGKAIFCEKPVHLDLARVRDCLATVRECNVPLFIGFNRRYDPQFRKVREMLSAGAIGKAESLVITSRDPSPPPATYVKVSGGMFRDMTIHDFDMARFIMGEDPVAVYAKGSNLVDPAIGAAGDIDTAFVVLTFPSGAMATISNSRRSGYGYDQRIELHGSQGLLTAKNIHENAVEQWSEAGCVAAKPEHFFLQRYAAAYQAEWEHFADVLAGRAEPQCSGYDGEQALYLADKALESLRSGKEVQL
ncbi:MAG: inositol 2-dehydrogenase, partial [Plesiomonas shigelloides]